MPSKEKFLPPANETNEISVKLSTELNEIFENAAILLMLVNSEGRVVKINRAGLELTGKSEEYILGLLGGEVFNCVNAWHDGRVVCGTGRDCSHCSVRSLVTDTFTTGTKHYKVEGKMDVLHGGKRITLELMISTSVITAHNEQFVLLTIDDVTKLKQQERQLIQLNADKDRFMQILAHDLKNPFNLMLGYTELLHSKLHKMDLSQIETQIEIVHSTAKNTYNLLEDLLVWSKSQAGKLNPEPLIFKPIEHINQVINQLQPNADSKLIQFEIYIPNNIQVYADLNVFSIVVRNLISNAIKYSLPGGNIKFSLKESNNMAEFCIMDEGIGIDEATLALIGIASFINSQKGTKGEKGTGIGLKLCSELIEKSGGRLWAKSKIGQGSEFYFTFPIKP